MQQNHKSQLEIEEALSTYLGDVIAHSLCSHIKRTGKELVALKTQFEQDLATALTNEWHLAPCFLEVEAFNHEVDQLAKEADQFFNKVDQWLNRDHIEPY